MLQIVFFNCYDKAVIKTIPQGLMGDSMMQKHIFFIVMYGIFLVSTMQSSVPLIHANDVTNLSVLKHHIKNIQFEDIVFDVFQDATKNKTIQRRGIMVRRQDALGTVLICHGYLGCKRDSIALKHLFPLYNVVAFDFRAHGEDRDGQVSTIGRDEAFDIIGAVKVIKADPAMKDKPVIGFGFSMGAVALIQAQAMHGKLFDTLILDCPYDSTDAAMSRGLEEKLKMNVFGYTFKIPGKQFVLDHMYDDMAQMFTNTLFKSITKLDSKKVQTRFVRVQPIESIKNVTIPCFFIHCEQDKKVPIEAVEQMYKNKPGFKRLWITPGKAHFGSYANNPEMYWYKINKFLTKLRQQDLSKRVQAKVCDQRTQVTMSNAEPINKSLLAQQRKKNAMKDKKRSRS